MHDKKRGGWGACAGQASLSALIIKEMQPSAWKFLSDARQMAQLRHRRPYLFGEGRLRLDKDRGLCYEAEKSGGRGCGGAEGVIKFHRPKSDNRRKESV